MRSFLPIPLIALTLLSACAGGGGGLYDFDGDGIHDGDDCAPSDPDVYPGAPDPHGDSVDQNCDGGDGVDADGDGFPTNVDDPALRDCNDVSADVHPGPDDVLGDEIDSNCDGHDGVDADQDGFASSEQEGGTDCDDADPEVHPIRQEVCADGVDNDCSGQVDDADEDLDGFVAEACDGDDCADDDALVHPDAAELCNEIDDNCDSVLDNVDLDGDGQAPLACGGMDCDDLDPTSYDTASELADGRDNDCDGSVDEGTEFADDDGDGFCEAFLCSEGSQPGDCDDASTEVAPGLPETCGDGLDNDCSGVVDDLDGDSDGFVSVACGGSDCDDANGSVAPGQLETCGDGLDNDCSSVVDDLDADYDGVIANACGGDDCDDGDATISPLVSEIPYDGTDNDCNGADLTDVDGDGSDGGGGPDCDDLNPSTYPGAVELPDGDDNDCDGQVDEGTALADDDGDGYCESLQPCSDGSTPGDCDDTSAATAPNLVEVCDGVDNDCDAATDELVDGDGDGSSVCQADCDDLDPTLSPDAVEICGDGIDNDCEGTADGTDCQVCDLLLQPPGAAGTPVVQPAIDAATAGQILCLDQGTFTETIDYDGNDVTVIGLYGPELTILDAAAQGTVVTFNSGETSAAVLSGVTVTGGLDPVASWPGTSGGIFVDNGSAPTLTNLIVRDNDGRSAGGGLTCLDGSVVLEDCDFLRNQASDGGGAFLTYCSLDAEGGSFVDNGSSATNFGGAFVAIQGASATIVNVSFVGNEANYGGAIGKWGTGTLSVVGGAFEQNTAFVAGGAIRSDAGTTLDGASFSLNSAFDQGGAVQLNGAGTVNDCAFEGNSATEGGALSITSTTVLTGTVLTGNSALRGGGMHVTGNAAIDGSSLVGNVAGLGGGGIYASGNVDISNTTLQGNDGGLTSGGGLVLPGGTCSIANSRFESNIASGGGAIRVGLPQDPGSCSSITNTAFIDNDGGGSGGAIFEGYNITSMSHCVFAGNVADNGAALNGVPFTTTDSIFVGNVSTSTSPTEFDIVLCGWNALLEQLVAAQGLPAVTTTATGLIGWGNSPDVDFGDCFTDASWLASLPSGYQTQSVVDSSRVDPEFMDSSGLMTAWDLHLSPTSPLIDAGAGAALDPDGSLPDIGLYGGPGADSWDLDGDGAPLWWMPGPYDSSAYPSLGYDCDDTNPNVGPNSGC